MRTESDVLSRIRIASPCPASWEQMRGNDRVRFCGHCQKHVYNLSVMTHREAEQLIIDQEGALCARLAQRVDGTVITRDCPVGVRLLRQRLRRVFAGAVGVAALLISAVAALGGFTRNGASLRRVEPFQTIAGRLNPPQAARVAVGRLVTLGYVSTVTSQPVGDGVSSE